MCGPWGGQAGEPWQSCVCARQAGQRPRESADRSEKAGSGDPEDKSRGDGRARNRPREGVTCP